MVNDQKTINHISYLATLFIFMVKGNILIIGACGQIGVELTLALRKQYGEGAVIATDIKPEHSLLQQTGPFKSLDVLDKIALQNTITQHNIKQVYLLAAILSATGERNPQLAWYTNMQSLLNVLEVSVKEEVNKVFWPSSIAVFGPNTPKQNTPQETIIEPTTIYGISKLAGERWCAYYHQKFGIDIRSLRYPGLISYLSAPGGGTTDYAVDIFYQAIEKNTYTCFLQEDTVLPMMYMTDAVQATLQLMNADTKKIKLRSSYNIAAMSFSPKQLAQAIQQHIPKFTIQYQVDERQKIAEEWPQNINDTIARQHWGWQPQYNLEQMVVDMLLHLKQMSKLR